MKRIVVNAMSVAAVSLLSVGGLATVQVQAAANQPVTITLWDNHPELQGILTQLVANFEKQYPNIKVDFQEIPVATRQQQYQAAVQGGTLPDVFALFNYTLGQYVSLNTLHNLDSLFPASVQKQYAPGTFAPGYSTMNGHVYMLPLYAPFHSGNVLYYNKDILKKYGLSVPKTWAQLDKEGKELYQKSGGKVYGLAEPVNTTGLLTEMATSIDPDVDVNGFDWKTGKYDWNSPGFVQIVNFFKQMNDDHTLDPDDLTWTAKPQARAALAAGQAAFEVDGDWGGELITGLGFKDWGVAKLPTWNGKPYYWGYTGPTPEGLAINAKTKHWAQASLFVQYVAAHVYPLMADEGYDTSKTVKVTHPAFSEASQILSDLKTTSYVLPNVYQRNSATIDTMVHFDSNQPTENLGTIVQGYLTGQIKSPASELTKLTDEYNQLLAQSIQQSNGKVTEKDFVFPNWTPFKSYGASDYSKLPK